MKRLLRLCVLAALLLYSAAAFLGATPSFVRLPTPILIPSGYTSVAANVLSGQASSNLSADTHRVAFMFRVPSRGFTPDTTTLFGVYIRAQVVGATSADSLTCSLYVVTTGGVPALGNSVTPTLYHASAPHGGIAGWPADLTTTKYVPFATAAVCTSGQLIAAVISRKSGGTTATIYRSWTSVSSASQHWPKVMHKLGLAAWTIVDAVPCFSLRWSDYTTRYAYMDAGICPETTIAIAVDSGMARDEIGNRMLFPFPMKVIGAWVGGFQFAANATGELRLYDTTGTNGTLIASATFDSVAHTAGATGTFYVYFGTEVLLNANQTYRLAFAPNDLNDVQMYRYVFVDSTSKMYGPRITETSRANGGAWADTPKGVISHMGLIVSQLSAGLEGGVSGRRRRILGNDLDTVFLGMAERERPQ